MPRSFLTIMIIDNFGFIFAVILCKGRWYSLYRSPRKNSLLRVYGRRCQTQHTDPDRGVVLSRHWLVPSVRTAELKTPFCHPRLSPALPPFGMPQQAAQQT